MARHKNLANKGFEESAAATTRSTSRHGLGRPARRIKRAYNHAAKIADRRMALLEAECAAVDRAALVEGGY